MAKGPDERTVVFRHAPKNSIIPVISALGLQAAKLVGGVVIIESICNINGLGMYVF